MIELRHLRKEFEESTPLKDVNAVINNGEVVSVIGPSGTGKSTLIRCINMLNIPTSGNVIVDGVDMTDPATDINAMRLKIGMVFQSYNLYEHLTVIENVMLAQTELLKISDGDAYKKGMDLLAKVGLAEKALQYPRQLSGGQKQRVAIARTLATDPEIILFDEPTSALDPLSVGEVEDLIASLANEDRIMMIVTHSMSFAEKASNRVFFMDQGGIYEDGTPDQIFHHPLKERTQRFIFHQNNLELVFNKDTYDLEKCSMKIRDFCEKHGIGTVRTRRLELVMEELCSTFLVECVKVQEDARLIINYDSQKDAVSFVCKYVDTIEDRIINRENVAAIIFTKYVEDEEVYKEDEYTIITGNM